LIARLPNAFPPVIAQDPSPLFGFVQEVVARSAGVPLEELRAPTRCSARVARARQYAMYLGHTVLGLTISAIARGCGRHHSTVAHACRVIEEQRDDPTTDRILTGLEDALNTRRGDLSASGAK
jgi:chromosomal replication initiation ATPase DnaA